MANTKPGKAAIAEIARQCIDDYDKRVDKRFDDQADVLKGQNKILANHGEQLTRIDQRFQELHGNGSGRKGAIEKITDDISALSSVVNEMRQSQAVYYAEQRLTSATNVQIAHAKSSNNKKWIEWLKFLAGPIALVAWELFKIYVLGVKK